MSKLEEHMVLNPEMKKTFDETVRRSKAKAKSSVRNMTHNSRLPHLSAL